MVNGLFLLKLFNNFLKNIPNQDRKSAQSETKSERDHPCPQPLGVSPRGHKQRFGADL